MTSALTGPGSMAVTLSNDTGRRAREYLTFLVTVDGTQHLYWTPVDVKPGTALDFSVHYPSTISPPIIDPCAQKPWGIVEGTQPVVEVTDTTPVSP